MFKFVKRHDATFYMKSGNQFTADKVADFTVTYSGNTITKISGFNQHSTAKQRLLLGSLNLDQIEAITIGNTSHYFA